MQNMSTTGPKNYRQRVKAINAKPASPNPANFSTAKGQLPSYKKGGKVKETGPAILHKGETVVPVSKRRGTSDGYMAKRSWQGDTETAWEKRRSSEERSGIVRKPV